MVRRKQKMDDYDNSLLKKDEGERQKKQRWILIKKERNKKKYNKRVGRVKRIGMTAKRRENYPCEEGERGT